MKALIAVLGNQLVRLILPAIMEELIKFLEEITKVDIDKDGHIGFYRDEKEKKTVRETIERLTHGTSNI